MKGFDNENEVRLTKLEKFVLRNPDMQFDVMASQLNRSYGTMERACDRALKKTHGMTPEQIQALL